MPRIFAYPFVAFMAFAVTLLLWVLVWGIAFDGRAQDFKGHASIIFFIIWWSWAGVSVYSRYIKKPREEKKQRCAEAAQVLEKTIAPDSNLSAVIEEVRGQFSLVGAPRHRSSPDSSFDTMVELETQAFIISLFGKDGVIKSWNVR